MSDGELDDLYQEVWAGFTEPTSPNGTKIVDDVPMTATLDSPMLPEEYSTFSTCIPFLFSTVFITDW
jgi:hypothetical protein